MGNASSTEASGKGPNGPTNRHICVGAAGMTIWNDRGCYGKTLSGASRKAAAGWDMEKDPGLDDLGHAQAKAAALGISPVGPAAHYHQPPYQDEGDFQTFGEIWGIEPQIEKRVGEIRFPL